MEQNLPDSKLPGGLWPVMLTAFHEDGQIDWHGVDALTEWYLQAGAAGLFACCGSSEMYNLQPDERLALIDRVVRRVAGRVPIVATGTFGGSLSTQAAFIRQVADGGVQAVVLMPNQLVAAPESDGTLLAHLETLLALTGSTTLGLYECPSPYHRLFSSALTKWAAETGRFAYLKDTTCDPAAIRAKLEQLAGSALQLYNANTQSALVSLQAGAAGISPIAANVYPEFFTWLCANYASQPAEAQAVQWLLTLWEANVSLQYPASAKWLIQQRGVPITTACRSRALEQNHNLRAMGESLLATVQQAAERFAIPLT
ncbi:MAG: dihydrodipicolinate synthase family protein [Caldilineaceae bacterium]|nr:dihydrodipicolinate synthase family protein [Caldilineaceae bacterium]